MLDRWPLRALRALRQCRRGTLAVLVLTLATASLATTVSVLPASASPRTKRSGPVDVLFAGSLVTLMQTTLDAAFHAATGYTVTGIPAGSTALAQEIKGGVHRADVFISAAPRSNAKLEGRSNGGWVSWYSTFATSPLLLGYDPSSPFARTLRTRPWWKVITKKGFLVGRTNPVTDPKGVLAVKALDRMARKRHDRALRTLATAPTNVFPEQTMVGRLQAGQLDAGFFYGVEASAAKIPTVPLGGVKEAATFTVTILRRAPHRAAAVAFVAFLLGHKGRAILRHHGLTPKAHPRLSGKKAAVPARLRKVVG